MSIKQFTAYGRVMAKIRIDRGINGVNQAKMMKKSRAFISARECGQFKATDNYIAEVNDILNVTEDEKAMIRDAVAKDRVDDALIDEIRRNIGHLRPWLISGLKSVSSDKKEI